jgi:hypothetical protein
MNDIVKPTTPKNGVWQRLLDALYENLGKVVTNEELIKVSGQHNYARRIRELRAEGWDVKYVNSPSGYILMSAVKADHSADEYINLKLRTKILERDNFTCQLCGSTNKDRLSDKRIVKLEVDHIIPLTQGGKTVEENLWTLCSRCNAGKKSLFAYPETVKNRIITLNLPDDLRIRVSEVASNRGLTVNTLLLDLIRNGLKQI